MQTVTAERALWLNRRRTTRRALFGFTLLFAAFFASALWLNDQDYRQWLQQAAQYHQDCKSGIASPNCQTLPMQIAGYRQVGDSDSANYHDWLVLQGKSGEKLEAEVRQRLNAGDAITALVWNGEVEEVSDGGTTRQTEANPRLRADAKRGYLTALWIVSLFWFWLVVPLTFIGTDKLHEKQWRDNAGNNARK